MRAVLCKNVPAMRDFRDVICPAVWKNPCSVCGHVAPFPVFPEFFSDFLPFGGGVLAGISQPGEEKWSPGSFFRLPAVIKLAVPGEQIRKIRDFFGGEERIFSGFSFRSLKKMSLIADKLYRVSVVSSRRERFINLFFSVRSRNSFMCACFFLFVCTCTHVRVHTPARNT